MALGRFKFFPLFLGIISCLSLIVCVITDYWYVVKRSKDEQTNEGLWKICDSLRCKKISGSEYFNKYISMSVNELKILKLF